MTESVIWLIIIGPPAARAAWWYVKQWFNGRA